MHSGPLCLQEGASNLLLSLALAHWIKVDERYPAGRPISPSGDRQEARPLSTRAAPGAPSLLNVPARRRERCRWAPAAHSPPRLVHGGEPCSRCAPLDSPRETLSPPACSHTPAHPPTQRHRPQAMIDICVAIMRRLRGRSSSPARALSGQARLASYNRPSARAIASCNSGLWHGPSQRSCRRTAITLRHELVSSSDELTCTRLCEVRAARPKPQK